MVMIVVSGLLSTKNCSSTWRGDSSGDPSYEVGDNQLTNTKIYLVVVLHNPLTMSVTESSGSG